ncbi:nuclear pore complex protein NUP1-like isoform X2 [Nymphaea colorata]|uniref:nuclear pore complex protein NUP1-like isoform X2 n=1 Tax=Nymphaea colorata TaxID=210225 RepID=UPI00129E5C16|nr:nuclear pore complex protein NUP1-like isoform X2 [Nymphaea colorata]
MATETGTYEGSAGGKFRKRPVRKSSTPYDRPATGSHALRNPLAEEKRNGWLSRIVNPASRIITSSATRFFASMFQKRLTASASSPDVKIETIHQHPKTEPENLLKGKPEDFTSQEERGITSSISNRLDDFERMLKDKTLSRDELKRLTELLQSRVVDSSKDSEGKRIQVNTLNAATTPMTKNNISTPVSGDVNNLITDETTASPTEIAKAFMGGRPSALSPAVSGLRSRTYREFASLTPNAQSFPHVIKSVTASKFSGVSGSKEDAFFTPDYQGGRSVLYSPASPYPRLLTEVNREANGDSYIGLLGSSHWTHANDAPSIRKQVLKRRSSIFESDIGSISSMRRIRQKSNLMPSFKGNCLPSTAISLSSSRSHVRQSSVSSFQKPIQMPFQKCDSSTSSLAVQNGDDKCELANFAFVPPQSSERARKILEEVDKTAPSPKEKSTELQLAIAREKSPAKLTVGMLGGKALRSMEDIDMAKVPDRQVIASNGSDSFGKSFHIAKKDRMEENGLVAGTSEKAFKAPSKGGLTNGISNFADSLSGKMSTDSSAERHPQTRRPFQMAAPEMDEDSCNVGDVSAKSLAQIEKEKPYSENSTQKPLCYPPEKKPATAIGPLFTNGTAIHDASNFTFSVVPPLNSCSKPSSTLAVPLPVQPLPVYDKPVETKEPAIVKSSMIPSIAMTSVGDDALSKNICGDSVGVDALSKIICGETKTGSSETVADLKTLAHQTNFGSYKDVEQRVDETAIPAVSSVSSSSILSGFGTSSIPNLSSGSSKFSCSASQGSFAPLAPFSAVSNATTITTSSALPSASSSIQFSTGNLYAASGASSSPLSSRPDLSDLTPKVSENLSVLGKNGSASPIMSEKSHTTTSASGRLQISASAFGSTVPPVDLQPQAGTGTPVEDTRPSGTSQFSSSASLPTFGLSSASTFASGSSLFGSSFGSGPAISSSSLGSISFGAVDQTTSSSSTVLSASFGSSSQSQSLFSSGFSSPSPASSGFTFGGSSSGVASITSGLSFGGSAASAGSSTAGFSFGGSSAVTTSSSSPASTGFSFGGFSSGSASLSSAVGSFGATTSATVSALSTGFSFSGSSVSASTLPSSTSGFSAGGSSMGAATSSSCGTGFSFGAPSVGSNTSPAFTAGFSVGGSSKGASASLSPATTGFSFGGSSVGSTTTSSSTASFSFGTPSAGSSSSVGTSFSFGLSPGASSPSTTAFSFGAGAASSPVASAFSFGASTSSNSVPFAFGSSGGSSASTGSLFSFTASASSAPSIGFASKTAPAPAQPLMAFASASPGNDQMNIEDSMAEDTVQASMAVTPAFTMTSSASSNFTFGSPSAPAGQPVFSFGAPQGGSTPPAPSPFAAGGGSLEFAGGSFSLGTNGGDKSGRKFLRMKRDKSRKK